VYRWEFDFASPRCISRNSCQMLSRRLWRVEKCASFEDTRTRMIELESKTSHGHSSFDVLYLTRSRVHLGYREEFFSLLRCCGSAVNNEQRWFPRQETQEKSEVIPQSKLVCHLFIQPSNSPGLCSRCYSQRVHPLLKMSTSTG
jgi:hypothetical protein